MAVSAFTCQNLQAARAGRVLFSSLGFSLLPGASLVITGRNGSGKTTLLKLFAGLSEPDAGEMSFGGTPVREHAHFQNHINYVGHKNGCFDELTVEENLNYWAGLRGEPLLVPAAMHHFGLTPYAGLVYAKLSAGWKRRVALARLLILPRAKIWLLDEPHTHLDEDGIKRLNAAIYTQSERGGITLYTAHNLDLIYYNTHYLLDA